MAEEMFNLDKTISSFRYLKHRNNDAYKYNGWELLIIIGDV